MVGGILPLCFLDAREELFTPARHAAFLVSKNGWVILRKQRVNVEETVKA